MEEVKRKEAELLKHIKDEIALYNEITENKVKLVYLEKERAESIPDKDIYDLVGSKQIHIPMGVKKQQVSMEGKRYVGNLFVCAYDEEVGLFIQANWTEKTCNYFLSIYTGVGVEKTGIWKSVNSVLGQKQQWLKRGEIAKFKKYGNVNGQSEATCNMYAAMNFEEMRNMMRKLGLISSYNIAYASIEEIEEVLAFAGSYFRQEMGKKKEKVFSKFPRR